MSEKQVLLLKDAGADCKYKSALGAAGYTCFHCPVLSFERNEAGVQALANALGQHPRVVILTSPRAADIVASLVSQENLECLRKITWVVVGAETEKRLLQAGLESVGSEAGSADALLPVVQSILQNNVNENDATSTCLFICGNIRRDTIPNGLKALGIPFQEICVYSTQEESNLDIPEEFKQGKDDGKTSSRWCVFFSPSGVRSCLASESKLAPTVRLVAIGKTTAEALRSAGYLDIDVALRPSPQGVLAAIENVN